MPTDLSPAAKKALLSVLESRFAEHARRHPGLAWKQVQERLVAQPEKLWSLSEMERTGGEPDVVSLESAPGEVWFCDCARESPVGRRSLCYDRAALDARKAHKPVDSAQDLARAMGIELLTEAQYLELQTLGPFDTKTSSWLLTPPEMRKLGGALFGDHRFGRVFFYHNGADSYYGVRGFRGLLRV